MAYRLVMESVTSTSRLATALTPASGAADYGTVDGRALVVEDYDTAADLVDRYHNVAWADGPPDVCTVTKSDGETCGRALPCPYHSDDDADAEA